MEKDYKILVREGKINKDLIFGIRKYPDGSEEIVSVDVKKEQAINKD